MFYISKLDGLQAPFTAKKIAKNNVGKVTQARAVSVYDGNDEEELKRNSLNENPYKERQEKRKLKRKLPKYAKDIMSYPVLTIRQKQKIIEAKTLFSEKRFRHIPVIDDLNRLVGIISDRDVLVNDDKEVIIADIMSKDIITARPEAPLRGIVKVLIEERIGCIPIISEKNILEGILTRTDVLRSLVKNSPLDLVL